MSGAICWPEQFPGEYNMSRKVWDEFDIKFPKRNRSCSCTDSSEMLCRHCSECGRFMSDMGIYSSEIGGLLAVTGKCKVHGEQCADMDMWSYTEWEG